MKLIHKLVTIAAMGAPLMLAPFAFGQDTSGDSMLAGKSFRFRYVAPINYNSAGNIIEVLAANGVITFASGGTYTIAAGSTYIDNTENSGKAQEFPSSAGGYYGFSAAGIGYIESPLASLSSSYQGVYEFGTVSTVGTDVVFSGSATDAAYELDSEYGLNDLFVAMLVGTPATNSTFTSPYWLGLLDFAGGGDVLLKNAMVEITPNGNGSLGTLSVSGFNNDYEAGTLLSCGHDGCGCRVRIEVACHCSGDQAYVCKCGDEMVEVAS